MRRMTFALGVLGVVALGATASADAAPAPALAPASAPAPIVPVPAPAPAGLAVVAVGGATDAAWPLARAIYGEPSLRAVAVDEAHARVLCGEPAASTDAADLRDLADTVAALRGDDAPSRALLVAIARQFGARELVVVRVDAGKPVARVFLADPGAFDAATYAPDPSPTAPSSSPPAWSATTRSLARVFGPTSAPSPAEADAHAPPLATQEAPRNTTAAASSKPFYASVWFWGAIGAAALAGGATYFATRDSSPSTIHLEVQVPH
jgi:hypothetical protein